MTQIENRSATTTTFTLDVPHSSAQFRIRHMMIANVRGRIAIREATLYLDSVTPTSSRVEARLDATSVDTGDAQRDAHLRGVDFFASETHPSITFVSRSAKTDSEGEGMTVRGDLT